MKLYYPLFLLFILFGSTNAFAQTPLIKGSVNAGSEAVAYATVVAKTVADSTFVKAEVTDNQGKFVLIGLSEGEYFVEVSYVGYMTYASEPFTLGNGPVDLGDISIKVAANDLEEVVVKAIKPIVEVQADKTIFNVENTLSATGSNGFELLRKAPGVIIDNSDRVILDGKTGVQVYIDGKPSPLAGDDLSNYLRSLQSSDIKSIEIITQPSSKYDAAGTAGIINILLKKDKRLGTNGTISAGVGQGRNTRYNGSLSLNNRTKKTNVFTTISGNQGQNFNFIYLKRTQNGVIYDNRTESTRDNNAANIKLGMDYFPKDNHTVGFILNGNLFDSDALTDSDTPISTVADATVTEILSADNEMDSKSSNYSANINYRFADTLGHELLFDIDYGLFSKTQGTYQPNTYFDAANDQVISEKNFRMNSPTDVNIFTTKVDYSTGFLKGKLGFGAKYSNVQTDNTFDFYDEVSGQDVFNAERSNQFVYTENINAAYANYAQKWGKWSMQAGLRVEQTKSEGDLTSAQIVDNKNVSRKYTDYFPSAGLTYASSWKSSWAFNYSRRVQRPNYQSLNPFETQTNELSSYKGNPFLQPQYTDNIKLSNTYKYRLTTSVSYSFIKDFFAQVTDTIGTDRNFLQPRNVANQEVYNFGLSYPFDVKKWWSVYMNINANRSIYKSSELDVDNKFQELRQNAMNIYAQNTFSLPKGFKFEVSGWFSTPSVWGGTYVTKSMGSLDLAVQKKFMNDKLSVRLAASDVLGTSFWRADNIYGDLIITGSGGWESQQVRLNLSYKFGNSEVKSARKRKTGLEDEGKRAAGGNN